MNIREISEDYAVDGQVLPSDMQAIADLGFKFVINNRPDGEEAGQALEADLRSAAEAAGLSYRFIPMTMPSLTPELVADHNAAIESADGPVFAFCRSGTRSTILWALTQVCFHGRSIAEVSSAAAAQGYDLAAVAPLLEGYRTELRG